MTLVYITHHNENVIDYEKVGLAFEYPRSMKYTSKHKKDVKKQINQPYVTRSSDGLLLIADSGKHERRTMGCAKIPLNPPTRFLRKNEGLKWRRLHDHICPKIAEMPPVPKRSQMPSKPVCEPPKVKTVEKQETPKEKQEAPKEKLETPKEKLETPKEKKETPKEKKETPRAVECASKQDVSKKQAQCKTETSRENPCLTSETRRKNICSPEISSKEQPCKVAQPCRTEGGFEIVCEKPLSEKPKKPKIHDPCKRTNFIALNIKRIKNAPAKRPPPRYIDTPTGETHNLINSGLIPQHVCGRNFAKVPCYIREHKKLIQKYNETCATELQTMQHCAEFMKKQGVRKMTLEERVALIEGLKANYMEQSKIFQTLSLYTDTPTKKLRKGRLEKDLDQLELDIKFIQDNAVIYVSDY